MNSSFRLHAVKFVDKDVNISGKTRELNDQARQRRRPLMDLAGMCPDLASIVEFILLELLKSILDCWKRVYPVIEIDLVSEMGNDVVI